MCAVILFCLLDVNNLVSLSTFLHVSPQALTSLCISYTADAFCVINQKKVAVGYLVTNNRPWNHSNVTVCRYLETQKKRLQSTTSLGLKGE